MATVNISTTANFDASQVVRRAHSAVIRSLEGAIIDRFEVHTDLVGSWEGADPNKAYAGLIPVIGGTARYDLALLTGELMIENMPSYPNGDDVTFVTPDDELHCIARKFLADNPNTTYDAWLNHIASQTNGFVVAPFSYAARNKRGGKWQNCIFGANKKA